MTHAPNPSNDGNRSQPALLSPEEVSRHLGVPTGTLANWRYRGHGPAYLRVGRHVRYRPADVTRWLESQLHPCEARTPAPRPAPQRRTHRHPRAVGE